MPESGFTAVESRPRSPTFFPLVSFDSALMPNAAICAILPCMNRRDFIRSSIAAGVAISLSDPLRGILEAAEPKTPDLAVVRGSSPERITRSALDALGGISRFVSRGDIVVVKPNIGWDRRPEFAATTNPEVVAALVRLSLEAGAKKVKVFDRPVFDARRCYKQSGIADAAGRAGAEVSYMDDRRFKDVRLDGRALKSWPIYRDILEADKVINVPIAKHHGLASLTMALKNWMGIMGGRRGSIHHDLDNSLVDVAAAVKPALTVLDAVRILAANGPQGGDLQDVRQMDTVVAGTDQVAVDSFGATLFGMKGSDLGYIRAAHQAGIGRMDISRLRIKKIRLG